MKMQKYVVTLVLDILQCVSLFTTRTIKIPYIELTAPIGNYTLVFHSWW